MDSKLWKTWSQPIVVVIQSDAVAGMCRERYGKSFAELLNPVADERCRINPIAVRTGSDHSRPFVSSSSSVSFLDAAVVEQRPLSDFLDTFLETLNAAELDMEGDGIRDALDARYLTSGKRSATPWFDSYRRQFLKALQFGDAELLHHPVALMFVVSAEEDRPANQMSSLRSTRSLPKAFQTGHFAPEIHRAHVVLATGSGNEARQQEIIQSVVQSVPDGQRSCSVLHLSAPPDHSVPQDTKEPASLVPSEQDADELQEFVRRTLIGVKEFVERKFALLSSKVNATRKGFKNQFKNLFSRRDAKSAPRARQVASGELHYPLDSIESQIRQLADLAFTFQDYELASSNYKLIASDYKSDKAQLHLASAHEMLAMSWVLRGDKDPRDVLQTFEAAYHGYCKCGDIPRATRTTLWAMDYLRTVNPKEAVSQLIRASEREQKDGVRAALLYEQAAYVFLGMKPEARIRKYAFHLIMAGHLFHQCGLVRFRIRCYQSAVAVYRGRQWFLIDDHILYHLGKDCFALNLFEDAVRHFVSLIGTIAFDSHNKSIVGKHEQPVERQHAWLEEFTLIVARWEADQQERKTKEGVISLDLPVFLDTSVEVLEDAGTVPASYAVGAWNAVDRINPVMSLSAAVCNTPVFLYEDKFYSEDQRCRAIGERIEVKVHAKNPLQVAIKANRIRLKCRYREEENEEGASPETAEGKEDREFECDAQDIELAPGGVAWVNVGVVCFRRGILDIEGVTWTVNDVINGFHRFNLPPKRMILDKGNRKVVVERINFDLSIPIVSELPILRVDFASIPSSMLQGECTTAKVSFLNEGKVALHDIQIRVSHPSFLVFSRKDSESGTPYDYDWTTGLVRLDIVLAPGDSVELPVSVRAAVAGQQLLDVLFRYTPVAPISGSKFGAEKFRIARWQHPLLVVPMFRVKLFSRVSFAEVDATTMGVEIHARDRKESKNAAPVKMLSMAVSSGVWKAELLVRPRGDVLLACGESKTYFLKASEVDPMWNADERNQSARAEMFSSLLRPNHSVSKSLLNKLTSSDMRSQVVSPLALADEGNDENTLHFVPDAAVSHLLQMEKELLVDAERSKLILNPNAEVNDYCDRNRVDLVIMWELDEKNEGGLLRRGYHHVIGVDCMKAEQSRCPVDVLVNYEDIEHDFQECSSVSVPIVIAIRNSLESRAVNIVFETLLPEESYDPSARRVTRLPMDSTSANYFWQGVTKKVIRGLQAHASTSVRLCAVFNEPGMYALNRFRVTVEEEGSSSSRLFFFPAQNLIHVKQLKFRLT